MNSEGPHHFSFISPLDVAHLSLTLLGFGFSWWERAWAAQYLCWGLGGQGKCAHLQARDEASGISPCYNGFPGSYPVIHGMTHGKLLGVTSLLWRQEWQVWSDWRASESRVAVPVTWFSWRLLLLRALFPIAPRTDLSSFHLLFPLTCFDS